MIDEDIIDKRARQKQFEIMQGIYNPGDSEDVKRFKRKQQLQKELTEIEIYEHRNDKKIEEMKKARLRKLVQKHISEQEKTNFFLNQRFEQMDINKSEDMSLGC